MTVARSSGCAAATIASNAASRPASSASIAGNCSSSVEKFVAIPNFPSSITTMCSSPGAPPASHTALSLSYRSEEHTSELQSLRHLVCRLLLEKKNIRTEEPTSETPHLRHVVCVLMLETN